MSRVVREPGCSAIASIGGTCDTYIVVAVAQERSSPCAAPTITTGCGICDRTVFAARYGSVRVSVAVTSHAVVARKLFVRHPRGRLFVVARRPGRMPCGNRIPRRARHRIGAEIRVGPRGARGRKLHAAARELLAGLVVLALDGEARLFFELLIPLAERIAIPRTLRPQRRKAELSPDRERVLHVLLRRQRDGRPGLLEAGVDEHPAVVGGIAVRDRVAALGGLLDARAAERRRVSLLEVPGDLHVERHARPVAHRPPERGRVVGIDVLVDRDADLSHTLVEARRGAERAPDLGFAGALRHLDDDELAEVRGRLVPDDPLPAADVARLAQVLREDRLVRGPLYDNPVRRRHPADERQPEWVPAGRGPGGLAEQGQLAGGHVT